jgi:hypothetical protein
MNDATTRISANIRQHRDSARLADAVDSLPPDSGKLDLKDPRVVLSLLEADQVVAAKSRTHFGRRDLSLGMRVLLWALRIYVLFMLVIVVISVLRAIHSAH